MFNRRLIVMFVVLVVLIVSVASCAPVPQAVTPAAARLPARNL